MKGLVAVIFLSFGLAVIGNVIYTRGLHKDVLNSFQEKCADVVNNMNDIWE